ncbi:MAG: hypothetical protein ABJP45_07570 [Cyclobacteriaceae bacterium]
MIIELSFKKRNLLFALFFVTSALICEGQNKRDTLRALFVGNSYIYYSNLPHIVSLISDSTSTKLITEKSTSGGTRLSSHWRGDYGLKTKELIKNGNFDIVVLQEQSMGTIQQPDSFLIYSKKFSEFIRENGAEPYFYMTWAREKLPQQQKTISKLYRQAAEQNDAGLVPAGEAWAAARRLRPDIKLYIADGSHPTPLGSLLTACVFLGTLTGELPSQLPGNYNTVDSKGESVQLMYHDALDVAFCLKIAEEYLN